jgi:hypothetical protein
MLSQFHQRLFSWGMWLWRDSPRPLSEVRCHPWNAFGVSASPETKPGLVAGLFVFAAMSSVAAPSKMSQQPRKIVTAHELQRNQSIGAGVIGASFTRRMQLSGRRHRG